MKEERNKCSKTTSKRIFFIFLDKEQRKYEELFDSRIPLIKTEFKFESRLPEFLNQKYL